VGAERREAELDLSGSARALLDAVTALGSDLDLTGVLERIVRSACQLTEARYGFLGVLGPEGTIDDFALHGVTHRELTRIPTLPKGLGILGVIISTQQPLRIDRISDHPLSYGFPPNHPPMETFLGVPVLVGDTVFGNLYLTEKSGGRPFTEQDEALVLALARAAGYVIDNARAFALSERRHEWLEAILNVNQALQGMVGVGGLRALVAAQARAVTEATLAMLVELDGTDFEVVAVEDGTDVPPREWAMNVADTLAGDFAEVDEKGEPVSISSGGRQVLLVPFRSASTRGVLVLVHPREISATDAEERSLLLAFARQSAVAIEQSHVLEVEQELRLSEDRTRIARDLHDMVIQRLFAIGLHLQSVRHLAVAPEIIRQLDESVRDIDATIRNIRTTIFQLEDPDFPSLRKVVRELVQEYAPILGFTPQLSTQGTLDASVPREVASHLVATLREGLSNVARHAEATEVEVEVTLKDDLLALRIADNGRGVPETVDESGLRNAARRATALGGRLHVGTRPGGGAVLEWEVPI